MAKPKASKTKEAKSTNKKSFKAKTVKEEIKKEIKVESKLIKSKKTPKNKEIKESLPNKKIKLELKTEIDEGSYVKIETGRKKYVGAHVSMAGGLETAITNSIKIGGTSFALFLTSQRQWNAKPLDLEVAKKFKEACIKNNFPSHLIIPHGSYLLNCGSPKQEVLEKSRNKLVDELKRCEQLGLTLYNFHPGSTCGEITVEECISKIAESINLALEQTKNVIAVIENMSCQGNTIGGKFSELHDIIDQVTDKSRVGVCLDTCHAFAAGYDISTEDGFNSMMDEFDKVIGFQYLKALHLNDSKGGLGCHLDRHENIGKGKIGLKGFSFVMNDSRFNNLPLILETPEEMGYDNEIKALYKLMKN